MLKLYHYVVTMKLDRKSLILGLQVAQEGSILASIR